MAAMITTTYCLSPKTQTHLLHRTTHSLLCSETFKPIFAPNPNPIITNTLSNSRSSISFAKPSLMVLAISGLENGNSETDPNEFNKEAKIDLKLPRRSLQVQFTCDLCGERTQRLVNRLAYERGLIYVQCAGCLRHHKLVDNLGLVVEYNLRDEINSDIKEDGV